MDKLLRTMPNTARFGRRRAPPSSGLAKKIGSVHGTKKRYLREFSSTDEVEDRLGSGRWGALLGEVTEEAEGRGTRAEQSAPTA